MTLSATHELRWLIRHKPKNMQHLPILQQKWLHINNETNDASYEWWDVPNVYETWEFTELSKHANNTESKT